MSITFRQRRQDFAASNRLPVLAAAVSVLLVGYWIRFTPVAPAWLRDSGGGAAYVTFWSLVSAVVWPRAGAARLATGAFAATCAVEFLQLWHPPWLEALRHLRLGRLLLGTTFHWGDFPPYAAGAAIGYLLLRRRNPRT